MRKIKEQSLIPILIVLIETKVADKKAVIEVLKQVGYEVKVCHN